MKTADAQNGRWHKTADAQNGRGHKTTETQNCRSHKMAHNLGNPPLLIVCVSGVRIIFFTKLEDMSAMRSG